MELSKTIHEGLVITGDPRFPALKLIKPEGKGSVPEKLRGVYTSVKAAKDHIDIILKERKANAPKDKPARGSKQVRTGNDNGSVPA